MRAKFAGAKLQLICQTAKPLVDFCSFSALFITLLSLFCRKKNVNCHNFHFYFVPLPLLMKRIFYPLVWLSRAHRCCGFGIQSPTDYRFVRYVVNEHWPYYAYAELGKSDDWLTKKIGHLCFRIANFLQPATILSDRYHDYLHAGCRKAAIVSRADNFDLAVITNPDALAPLLSCCNERTVVLIENIRRQPRQWRRIMADSRTGITFDLFYCGIVMFDMKRTKQSYTINF
jgi:hypothetical protein